MSPCLNPFYTEQSAKFSTHVTDTIWEVRHIKKNRTAQNVDQVQIDGVVYRSKLSVFGSSTPKSVNKCNQLLVYIKHSRLYVGLQLRDRYLGEFFSI